MAIDYEKQVEEMETKNEQYLKQFEQHLKTLGFTTKTVQKHIENVSFYINDYLCYSDMQTMDCGCINIGGFLGDWFIRKAMWSSCAQIKANAASIKKFYKYMLELGQVEAQDYAYLCESIKNQMPEWLDTMKKHDDNCEEEWDIF